MLFTRAKSIDRVTIHQDPYTDDVCEDIVIVFSFRPLVINIERAIDCRDKGQWPRRRLPDVAIGEPARFALAKIEDRRALTTLSTSTCKIYTVLETIGRSRRLFGGEIQLLDVTCFSRVLEDDAHCRDRVRQRLSQYFGDVARERRKKVRHTSRRTRAQPNEMFSQGIRRARGYIIASRCLAFRCHHLVIILYGFFRRICTRSFSSCSADYRHRGSPPPSPARLRRVTFSMPTSAGRKL